MPEQQNGPPPVRPRLAVTLLKGGHAFGAIRCRSHVSLSKSDPLALSERPPFMNVEQDACHGDAPLRAARSTGPMPAASIPSRIAASQS